MTLLINNALPTSTQLAAIRVDLGLGNGDPGAANGVAILNGTGLIPTAELPAATVVYGPYTTVALLEAAYQAASNAGKTAYIGATAPYTEYVSNSVSGVSGWKAVVTYNFDSLNNVNGFNGVNGQI